MKSLNNNDYVLMVFLLKYSLQYSYSETLPPQRRGLPKELRVHKLRRDLTRRITTRRFKMRRAAGPDKNKSLDKENPNKVRSKQCECKSSHIARG